MDSFRLPVYFAGHGASFLTCTQGHPTNESFRKVGSAITEEFGSHIRAIVVISAHFIHQNFSISSKLFPQTIHDHPCAELCHIKYSAVGSEELANLVKDVVMETSGLLIRVDPEKDLDHGAWLLLHLMFPEPTVPVLTMSIDASMDINSHLAYGRSLNSLRNQGFLFVGSGGIVHNQTIFRAAYSSNDLLQEQPEWMADFENRVIELHNSNSMSLVPDLPRYKDAHPSTDHLMPFLIISGLAHHETAVCIAKTDQPGLSTSIIRIGD